MNDVAVSSVAKIEEEEDMNRGVSVGLVIGLVFAVRVAVVADDCLKAPDPAFITMWSKGASPTSAKPLIPYHLPNLHVKAQDTNISAKQDSSSDAVAKEFQGRLSRLKVTATSEIKPVALDNLDATGSRMLLSASSDQAKLLCMYTIADFLSAITRSSRASDNRRRLLTKWRALCDYASSPEQRTREVSTEARRLIRDGKWRACSDRLVPLEDCALSTDDIGLLVIAAATKNHLGEEAPRAKLVGRALQRLRSTGGKAGDLYTCGILATSHSELLREVAADLAMHECTTFYDSVVSPH